VLPGLANHSVKRLDEMPPAVPATCQ
jgi:hypothetical protein